MNVDGKSQVHKNFILHIARAYTQGPPMSSFRSHLRKGTSQKVDSTREPLETVSLILRSHALSQRAYTNMS